MPESGAREWRSRLIWLGVLLTLIAPGLGQVYAGRLRRGLLWFAASFLLTIGMALLIVNWWPPRGVVGPLAVFLGFHLLMIADTVRTVRVVRTMPQARRFYQQWFVYLVIAVAGQGSGLLPAVICKSYMVPTRSMDPTIQVGDRVMADMTAYFRRWPWGAKILAKSGSPVRGDVVVFIYPDEPGTVFVKRIIGLAGDLIEVRGGRLLRNGAEVSEPYAHWGGQAETTHFGPYRVPSGAFFVMGDNRAMSLDSRHRGTIPVEALLGRVLGVSWSLDPEARSLRWPRFGLPIAGGSDPTGQSPPGI